MPTVDLTIDAVDKLDTLTKVVYIIGWIAIGVVVLIGLYTVLDYFFMRSVGDRPKDDTSKITFPPLDDARRAVWEHAQELAKVYKCNVILLVHGLPKEGSPNYTSLCFELRNGSPLLLRELQRLTKETMEVLESTHEG